jgi:hypothetical protein
MVRNGLDQSGYNREEVKDESSSHESKKVRPIEEKESFRSLWNGWYIEKGGKYF